jgi:SulP family sulfate permease
VKAAGGAGSSAWRRWLPTLPVLQWGRQYNRDTLASDGVAAAIVTIMLIPQSLAYAMLAGLVARIMLMPVGLLEQAPVAARMLAVALATVIMVWRHPRFGGLVPALVLGCVLLGGMSALG